MDIMESYKVAVLLLLLVSCIQGRLKTYDDTVPAFIQNLKPSIMCLPKNVSDSTGLIISHLGADVEPYAPSSDCLFTINTAPGRHINLRFEYFDLEHNFDTDTNRCRPSGDRLEIYESGSTFWIQNGGLQPDKTLCGGTGQFPADYQSVGNIVTVRLITDEMRTDNKGLQFVYSSYSPPEDEVDGCFLCGDGIMCLDSSLHCDGIPQCNDDSDEEEHICSQTDIWNYLLNEYGFTMVVIVGSAIIVFIVFLLVVCVCCCCFCCRKKDDVQEQKQYQRAPPVPRPNGYPTPNSNVSNYSSYSSSVSNQGKPPPQLQQQQQQQQQQHYPNYNQGGYPMQNGHSGGYHPVYNPANGRAEFPHKV